MKFTLSIDCDNAAFDEDGGSEVARILREAARWIGGGALRDGASSCLRDINGNEVGQWVTEEAPQS